MEERRLLSLSVGPLAPKTLIEGSSYADAAVIVDPAATGSTTYTATVNYGDGTVDTNPKLLNVGGDELLVLDHVYGDEGSYNVTASVQDSLGSTGTSNTAAITISESAITLAAITTQTATEASPLTVSETFADPGWGPGYSATIDWGDGSTAQPVTPSNVVTGSAHTPTTGDLGLSHTYANAGRYTTQLSIAESDNATTDLATQSFSIVVDPVANPGGPYYVGPGRTLSFDGTQSGQSGDGALTYAWSVDGQAAGTGATPSVAATGMVANTNHTVSLVVTDAAGDVSAPASTTLHVHPLTAPVAVAGGPYTDVEGQTVTLDGSGSSIPVSDTMGITDYKWIDADDGSTLGHGKTLPVSVSQNEDILLTVTDNDGLSDSTSSVINFESVATPTTTTIASSDSAVVVGQTVTFTATVAATGRTPTGIVTFIDGTTQLGQPVTLVNGIATFQATLPLGIHVVRANYSGDASFEPSASRPVTNPNIVTAVGGLQGYSGDSGPAIDAELSELSGVATDGYGNLFIADSGNDRIREVNHATGVITTVAGNGVGGFAGDGGPATAARLGNPIDVAVDSAGDIFIADDNNYRIREVNATTGTIATIAGDGQRSDSGDGGPATAAGISGPDGLAFDTAGNLIIDDWHDVRELNIATGVIQTLAGTDTFAYSGDNSPATAASLAGPEGIAVDPMGDVYIADTYNNRVREIPSGASVAVLQATSTTLTTSAESVNLGDQVTLTANVAAQSPSDGSPSGSVTFMDGDRNLGTINVDVNGNASTQVALSVGTHDITAAFNGDGISARSTSNTVTVYVSQAPTTTTLSAPASMTEGQGVTLTATVAANTPGIGTPDGTVTFMDGGTALGNPVTLDSTGTATTALTTLPSLGTNAITVVYNGNPNFATSVSSEIDVSANPAVPNISTGGDVYSNNGSCFMSNTVSFSDPNPGASVWYVSCDYGDGSSGSSDTYYAAGTYTVEYRYASAGTYGVTVSVTDNLVGTPSGSATFTAYLS